MSILRADYQKWRAQSEVWQASNRICSDPNQICLVTAQTRNDVLSVCITAKQICSIPRRVYNGSL